MKIPLIIIFPVLTLLFSCDSSAKKTQHRKIVTIIDTLHQDRAKTTNSLDKILKAISKNTKPVFGYRFIISGDFDGDGKKEKLIEHFFSGLDNSETNKFYDSLSDYNQLVALTVKKNPFHL